MPIAVLGRLARTAAVLAIGTLTIAGCAQAVISLQYPTHPQAVPAVGRLVSDDPLLAQEAKVEIASLGEGAMPELLRRMQDSSPEGRVRIVEIATQIGRPTSIVGLIYGKAVKDPAVQVRQAAAFQGARKTELAAVTTQPLRSLLEDPVPEVRAAALSTLGGFGSESALSHSEVVLMIGDRDPLIAATAASVALSRNDASFQAPLTRALPRLIANLHAQKPATRAAVVSALGLYREQASPAVPPLVTIARHDPVPEIRMKAAIALSRIGTPAAADASKETFQAFSTSEKPALKALAQGYLRPASEPAAAPE